jgi:hypothetical protein
MDRRNALVKIPLQSNGNFIGKSHINFLENDKMLKYLTTLHQKDK